MYCLRQKSIFSTLEWKMSREVKGGSYPITTAGHVRDPGGSHQHSIRGAWESAQIQADSWGTDSRICSHHQQWLWSRMLQLSKSCNLLFLAVDKHNNQRKPWEERIYLVYRLQFILEGSKVRNSSSEGTGGSNHSRSRKHREMLLTGFFPCIFTPAFLFLFIIQDHFPRGRTAQSVLSLSTSIVYQKMTLLTYLQDN